MRRKRARRQVTAPVACPRNTLLTRARACALFPPLTCLTSPPVTTPAAGAWARGGGGATSDTTCPAGARGGREVTVAGGGGAPTSASLVRMRHPLWTLGGATRMEVTALGRPREAGWWWVAMLGGALAETQE
jgi:hypothetical protein